MTTTTKQQQETLEYFTREASQWSKSAASSLPDKVNIIRQRNGFVLDVLSRRSDTCSALDVGCGAGDLVCDIARRGIPATGVDFSEEMIRIAEDNAQREFLQTATFYCSSIFAFHPSLESFDIISANGFIEYISHEQLIAFVDLCSQWASVGGSLVLGSRNRLFNILSLNAFTEAERREETLDALLCEALAIASGAGMDQLLTLSPAPLQRANTVHAQTGVEVSTRYQYTPAQLVQLLAQRGFVTQQIYPAHIHGVPPTFANTHPTVHTAVSNMLQQFAHGGMTLVPFASTFMLHATKQP